LLPKTGSETALSDRRRAYFRKALHAASGHDVFQRDWIGGIGRDGTVDPTCFLAGFSCVARDARVAVFKFIEGWYNPHRHSALGYLSPINYERMHEGAA
jgi:transposase InsO family protein